MWFSLYWILSFFPKANQFSGHLYELLIEPQVNSTFNTQDENMLSFRNKIWVLIMITK